MRLQGLDFDDFDYFGSIDIEGLIVLPLININRV